MVSGTNIAVRGLIDHAGRLEVARHLKQLSLDASADSREMAACAANAVGLVLAAQYIRNIKRDIQPIANISSNSMHSEGATEEGPFYIVFDPHRETAGAQPLQTRMAQDHFFLNRFAGEKATCQLTDAKASDLLPTVFGAQQTHCSHARDRRTTSFFHRISRTSILRRVSPSTSAGADVVRQPALF